MIQPLGKQTLIRLFAVMAMTSVHAVADLPEALQGSWILDEEATTIMMQKSPKWDAEAETMLPRMLKMMSRMCIEFDKTTMTNRRGERKETVTPTLISSENGKHRLSIVDGERTVYLTAIITKGGRLNLKADKSDDGDYLMWKRGTPSANAPSEASVMAEMMQAAMQDGVQKSVPTAPPPQQAPKATPPTPPGNGELPAFKAEWGTVTINQFTDEAIQQINALPAEERKRVQFHKSCTQEAFERVKEIAGIENLYIAGNNGITSIAPVAELSQLKLLRLYHLSGTIDLSPLAGLTSLEELDCIGTEVTHADALANLPNLKTLSLYMAHVDSIDFLRTTPSIEELNLYGTAHAFPNYEPLLGLKKLKDLNVYMNPTARDELLQPLVAVTSLEVMSMSNCGEVTTVAFLANASKFRTLKASWCRKLADISALADKTELEEVDIEDSVVTDFTPLQNKPKLKVLDLSGTAFSDLSLLKASTGLSRLKLDGCPITDFSVLAEFKELRSLDVSKDVTDAQLAAVTAALPTLRIRKR